MYISNSGIFGLFGFLFLLMGFLPLGVLKTSNTKDVIQ